MNIDRRRFIGTLLGAGAYAVSARAQSVDDPDSSLIFSQSEKRGLSILQGMSDETSAQFSIIAPKAGYTFEVVRRDGVKVVTPMSAQTFDRAYSSFFAHKILVEGLQLGVDYLLRCYSPQGQLADEREFLALDLSKRSVRAAFVSCQLDLLHRDDVWVRLEEQNPEIVFFLGDNVYADRTSFVSKKPANEKQLWERYVLTRNRVHFYFQKRLRPVIATWDDHDYGADNQGRGFVHKEAARVAFETFFAQEARPNLIAGPGISRRFSAFGADFFMLDNRFFRDAESTAGAKLFGASQEKWLFGEGMVQPRATMLLQGTLWYGGYTGKGSFEHFGDDFKNFKAKLKDAGALACFGSGDVHFSEVMEIEAAELGYPSFEIVSSGMHSYTFPGHENRYSNPRRKASTSAHNFVIFEGMFGDDTIEGVVSSFSANKREFQSPVSARR